MKKDEIWFLGLTVALLSMIVYMIIMQGTQVL